MKVSADNYLIEVESNSRKTLDIIGINGEKIIIDNDYNKNSHSCRIGKIYALPISVSSKYKNDVELNVGDDVVFHHFVCKPDHKMPVGENIYRAEIFHIYGKIQDGQLIALEDVLFIDPIQEKEEDLFCGMIQVKVFKKAVQQKGYIYALSKTAKDLGAEVGDIIYYTENADYKMNIGERDLFRMRIRNILAIERNGELICLRNRIFVKQDKVEDKVGSLISLTTQSELHGEVVIVGKDITEVKQGDKVSYFNGIVGDIVINGDKLSFVDIKNINYISN